MIRKFKFLLALMLTLTAVPLATQSIQADTEAVVQADYELYPIPQSIKYLEGEFILNTTVNVVTETEIDEYTIARLEEGLALKGITATYSDKIIAGTTNILVGVKGSREYVDAYFEENHTLAKANLFEKIDAHYLNVENDVITVLGKDTDSAFYGLTTLYHVLKQMDSFTIRNFVTEDYADVISRGFIEGYYGEPWSIQDRVDLMDFGGYYKSNSYFYAPKDDPKHNAQWRAPYNEEEIADMARLADAGNRSKNRFVYAIHPFMSNVFRFNNDDNYNADFEVLTTKLEQMLDVGVRQFSILGDDANVPGGDADNYVRLLVDLTDWIVEKQADYPGLKKIIPFVPNDYGGWGDSDQIQALKQLPENVQIVMTGGRVWGEVSQDFTSTFTKNAGRGPYMWINWPVTDNSKQHLIMGGGHKFLQPGVDPANIEGIVLNPMQQSEPSKLSIFYGAAYSWNIWEDEPEALETWENAFSYVDHNSAIETESSIAFKELSKHMINQNMDGRVVKLEESIDLAPKLNAFKEKLANNAVTAEDADLLIAEFQILADAAKTYRANPGNEKTRDQIVYWLNSWDDTTEAAISFLEAVKADLVNDQSTLVDLYSTGQEAFAKSKTYGFDYIDHLEYAEVGVQHIVPLIRTLDTFLSEKVKDAVGLGDPYKLVTNISSNPEGGPSSLKNLIDGKEDTFTYWKNYFPREGDFVGIDFKNEPQSVYDIEILLGRNATDHDTFRDGKIEYTVDGEEWITIDELTFANTPTNRLYYEFDEPLEILGFRVVNTKNLDGKWFAMREISFNTKDEVEEETQDFEYTIVRTDRWGIVGGKESNLYDGDDNTNVYYNGHPADVDGHKDYVLKDDVLGYDLGRAVSLDSVHLVVGSSGADKLKNYTVETSVNNTDWTAISEKYENFTGKDSGKDIIDVNLDGREARYVRVRNLQDIHKWSYFSEFTVKEVTDSGKETKNVYTNLEKTPLYSNTELGSASLSSGSVSLNEGQYIGLKLDHIKEVNSATVNYSGDDLVLEGSKNALEWFEIIAGEGFDARYVRLINKGTSTVTSEVNTFELDINEVIAADFLETSIPRHSQWSEGDVRLQKNGKNAFDGNLQTAMTVSGYAKKGSTILFDLGQKRQINSMRYVIDENVSNYIRDAVFEIGNDPTGDTWTELFTVGDGVENNVWDDSTAKDAEYLTHDSSNPGYMYKGNDDLDVQGRYLRVRFTSTYDHRFVGFNEIMINNGEYVTQEIYKDVESTSIEKPFQVASNMFDRKLGTAYAPADDTGEFTYSLSEPMVVRRIKLVQQGASSNATVTADLYTVEDAGMTVDTVTLGTLSQTISEFDIPADKILKSITVKWDGVAPVISEIINLDTNSQINKTKLAALIAEEVATSTWTTDSKSAYDKALATAIEINSSDYSSQSMVASAVASLQSAIDNGVNKFDTTELEELFKNPVSNADKIYTDVSFTNYENKLKPVAIALEDKNNLGVDLGTKLVKDIKDAIEAFEYSKYQSELAQLKLRDLKALDLTETDYTEGSYAEFIEESAALEALVQQGASVTPIEYRDQLAKLEEAELVSTLQLQASLAEFDATNEEIYTVESFKNYKSIADASRNLLVDGSKEAVAQAVKDLETARTNLVFSNKDLENILDEIKNLDKEIYASNGYNALIDYVEALDLSVSQEEQAVIYTELKELLDALVNVSSLKDKLTSVSQINKDTYTIDSYSRLEDAVVTATDLLTSAVNAEEVTSALEALEEAELSLESRLSQKEYDTFMDKVEVLDSKDFTTDSFVAYQEALDGLNTLELENTSSVDFLNLIADYTLAIAKLDKRVSQAEYDKFVNTVKDLDESNYSNETFKPYQDILDEIEALVLENTSQEEFINLVTRYNEALKNLVKVDVEIPVEPDKPVVPGTDNGNGSTDGTNNGNGTTVPSKPSTPEDSVDVDGEQLPATGIEKNYGIYLVGISMMLMGGLFLALKKRREEQA